MVVGILMAVIVRFDAAAQKSDRGCNQGKEQDAFHDKNTDDVKR